LFDLGVQSISDIKVRVNELKHLSRRLLHFKLLHENYSEVGIKFVLIVLPVSGSLFLRIFRSKSFGFIKHLGGKI
jgi:hypothetical protein